MALVECDKFPLRAEPRDWRRIWLWDTSWTKQESGCAMSIDLALVSALSLLTVLVLAVAWRRVGVVSAVGIFAVTNWVMAVGTAVRLDLSRSDDVLHAWVLLATTALFSLVAVAALLARADAQEFKRWTVLPPRNPSAVLLLILLSIVISVGYFAAIGYLAFFEGIRNSLSGQESDLATLRLQSYSGEQYFFPGYVNQFKNSLLPMLSVVTIAAMWQRRARFRLPLSIILGAISLVLLLGTGQRGAFVLVAIGVVVFARLVNPQRFGRRVWKLAFPVIAIFLVATAASGRAAVGARSDLGPLEQSIELVDQLVYRIFGSNQEASVVGFRYVASLEPVGGRDWWDGIVGLLPGQASQAIENVIFGLLYGSQRGTSPLSLWGSALYNFGILGPLLLAALIAILTVAISRAGARGAHRRSMIELAGIAGVSAVVGSWVAGSPLFLLNTGIVVYGFLWWWGGRENDSSHAADLLLPTRGVARRAIRA